MRNRITIVRKGELPTGEWSGGTTTELYIYPRGSLYALRDFTFRLSTATVTDPESSFTPLRGIDRALMVLEGGLTLNHDGGPDISLAPYEVHTFDGGASTTCRGMATDFNLMLRGAEGSIGIIEVASGSYFRIESDHSANDDWRYSTRIYYALSDLTVMGEMPTGPTAREFSKEIGSEVGQGFETGPEVIFLNGGDVMVMSYPTHDIDQSILSDPNTNTPEGGYESSRKDRSKYRNNDKDGTQLFFSNPSDSTARLAMAVVHHN